MKKKSSSEIVGDNIRKIREKKNLSQENLGLLTGKRLIAIKRIEAGEYKLTALHVELIAKALKIPFKILFEKAGPKPKKK